MILQIEKLVTEPESLKKNRDENLEDRYQKIQSLLDEESIPEAYNEYTKLFLLVTGLSGSLYVINDFAANYVGKLASLLEALQNKIHKLIKTKKKPYEVFLTSLRGYTIYLKFIKILVNREDEKIIQEYKHEIELIEQEIEEKQSKFTEEIAFELQLIVDFFKIGPPATGGLFTMGYYQLREEYVKRFHDYIRSNPSVRDKTTISNLCSNMGGILLEDQLEVAKEIIEFGLRLAQEVQSNALLTRSLTMLGHYYRLKGQLDIALDTYKQSVELENVPYLLFAYPIRHIGQILQTRGDLETGGIYYKKSLKLFEFVSNDLGVARTLQYIGNIHFLQAGFDDALDYYQQSLTILKKHNYQRMIVDVLYSFIRVYLEQSKIEQAENLYSDIERIKEQVQHKGIDQVSRLSQALIYKRSNRRIKKAKAQELLEQIVNEEILNHEYTIVAIQHLCELLVDEMRTEPEEEIFIEANLLVNRLLSLAQEQELYQVQIQALILQSQFDMVQGKFDETLATLSRAEEMCREKELPQLTKYVLQFRERYLAEFSKWQNIVHSNETIQERLANDEIQEYIKLALANVQEEKQQTETLLQTVLPVEIIPHLKGNNTEVYAERFEKVSILFADIVGFTSISAKLDPHSMVMLLNEIFTTFDTLLPKYDVEKIRTIGDNYMVVVGAPRRNSEPSKMIAKFALEISNYLRSNGENLHGLKFRIGINTGEVVAGVVGTDKFHFDVWGDAVNVAARMESHGIPDEIQVTEQVYNDLKDEFILEERGIIEIKGKEPIQTWFLVGERTD